MLTACLKAWYLYSRFHLYVGFRVLLRRKKRYILATDKKTYPNIPANSWWALRKQFNRTIPQHITPSYLVSVLGGTERSVKTNVLRGLRTMGLVEEDGTPTERATLWRDDTHYSDVCRQILDEVYPSELLNVALDPVIDKEKAKRWFMNTTGCGEPTAVKKVAMFALLAEADPFAGDEDKAGKSKQTKILREPKVQSTPSGEPPQAVSANHQQDSSRVPVYGIGSPEMRLSLEIRIDASITADQIDQIFASMAKHLYRRGNEE